MIQRSKDASTWHLTHGIWATITSDKQNVCYHFSNISMDGWRPNLRKFPFRAKQQVEQNYHHFYMILYGHSGAKCCHDSFGQLCFKCLCMKNKPYINLTPTIREILHGTRCSWTYLFSFCSFLFTQTFTGPKFYRRILVEMLKSQTLCCWWFISSLCWTALS